MKRMWKGIFWLVCVLGWGFEEVYLPEPPGIKVEVWVSNLTIPWSLVFLSKDVALVSERGGRVLLIEKGNIQKESYLELPVFHQGEAGLMGLAVHPDFPAQPYVYAVYTSQGEKGPVNRVVRILHQGKKGVIDRVILDGIPAERFHEGGRVKFGPDRKLYLTTGDALQPSLSQQKDSLAGKILRFNEDGSVPSDNPWGTLVWSMGHRNPQGLAWHPVFGMVASEHGPSGEKGWFGHDEINHIYKGRNYGWPEVIGAPGDSRYEDPLVFWHKATPPSGMVFLGDELFVATLRSEALLRIVLTREGSALQLRRVERWFVSPSGRGKYGRLRDVVVGPDGALYVLTSNRDGRGQVRSGDDKILRLRWEK